MVPCMGVAGWKVGMKDGKMDWLTLGTVAVLG